MAKDRVLVVEDNLLVCSAVEDILVDGGYDVSTAASGKEARELLAANSYALVLLDLMLPDGKGDKLLPAWRKSHPDMEVVFMTAHGDVPTAVEALRGGAYDFLVKPVEKNLLLKTVANAIKFAGMERKVNVLTELTRREPDCSQMGEIIGNSPPMMKTLKMAKTVAASDFSCMLITGESGTGKGLLARTIHKMGRRAKHPFVEVNCSALPANLVESELFGHKKGAFTDAKEDKIGLFEMADGGTLFLDEIGDMDFNLQAKLLKVIEDQKFRRVGDTKDVSVNVAIIAATNQDVGGRAANNTFRTDLYYRLNVIPVHIPPLRDRKEDIPALAGHFVKFFTRKFGKRISGFGAVAMAAMMSYEWPGNVREFRNVVERSCILTEEGEIDDPDILFPGGGHAVATGATAESALAPSPAGAPSRLPAMPLKDAEKMVIEAAMAEAQGNRNKAASILGLHRTTLYKKLEEYGIDS